MPCPLGDPPKNNNNNADTPTRHASDSRYRQLSFDDPPFPFSFTNNGRTIWQADTPLTLRASRAVATKMVHKVWGAKVAWAKAYFTASPSPQGTAEVLVARSARLEAKRKRQVEADPTTTWTCIRCGTLMRLPIDRTTGRVQTLALAEHLEGRAASGSGTIVSGVTACPRQILFDSSSKETANSLPHSKRPRQHGDAVATGVDAEAESLRALLRSWRDSGAAHQTRVCIVVENPKTPANMGSILRAMGCFLEHDGNPGSADKGTTPLSSDDPGAEVSLAPRTWVGAFLYTGTRLRTASETGFHAATDTHAAWKHIPQLNLPDLKTLFNVVRQEGTHDGKNVEGLPTSLRLVATFVAVDLIEGASPLPLYTHPSEASQRCTDDDAVHLVFYVFGAEDGTLSNDALQQCDEAIFMPTYGSMNLAASVNVLLYDLIAKGYVRAAAERDGSALLTRWGAVLQMRNTNNHLVWRSS